MAKSANPRKSFQYVYRDRLCSVADSSFRTLSFCFKRAEQSNAGSVMKWRAPLVFG